jgi:serine protease AprX
MTRLALLAALPLLLLAAIWQALPALSAPGLQAAVDSWILETVAEGGQAEFLVFLAEQADLSGVPVTGDKAARGANVMQHLMAVAERTQPAVIAELERLDVAYRPYWIANMIWVRGDAKAVERLASRSDVARLIANPHVQMALPPVERGPLAPAGVEPNLTHINAPAVWAAGIDGAGVVVGGQDTGYAWDHPALVNQYRGWDGAAASHDYHWYDAIHHDLNGNGGNPCGFDSPVPCDDNSHGTHTMGTVLGDDGGANQIGVAPGARWIGCRNMEQGAGTPATYSECFQWFIAPTDRQGNNPQPALAPDVINNSWTCPPSEGCTDPLALLTVVANVRQAGIVVVSAAGNSGPSCSSISYPPAIYDESLTVGATDSTDLIASFSSRGPVTIDGSYRLKPDVTAPGSSIRSSVPPNLYIWKSGTSMATPHVTGLVALLLQKRPELRGDVGAVVDFIRSATVPLTSGQGCAGDTITAIPNHVYGYGRIDAFHILEMDMSYLPLLLSTP